MGGRLAGDDRAIYFICRQNLKFCHDILSLAYTSNFQGRLIVGQILIHKQACDHLQNFKFRLKFYVKIKL